MIVKNIRRSVFETNSSSTHSISIVGVAPKRTGTTGGSLELGFGEYGWEIEDYNDWVSKADYCAIDNKNNEDRLDLLKKVIEKQTGIKNISFNFTGYIDHQSAGTSDDAFNDEETLRNFIFSNSSYLHTDNDNHY